MAATSPTLSDPGNESKADFWKFWTGQTISNIGNSITQFALPLLVFHLTGSAIDLAIITATQYLPYLLFGLLIGAWVDRVDRKRLMVVMDVVQGAIIISITVLSLLNSLPIWWIYLVSFINSTLAIGFEAGSNAAVASLVKRENLVAANGQLQASHSAGFIIGPSIAAVLIALMPIQNLFLIDGISFFVSAVLLLLVRRPFNPEATAGSKPAQSISADIVEGLRYVLGHPLLRNIALLTAFVNLFVITTRSQLVLFADSHLQASESQTSLLYSAGAFGVVLFSLLASTLRRWLSFSTVALGAMMVQGALLIVMAATQSPWLTMVLWGTCLGMTHLFSINTRSLRQAIVPNRMLGRVVTIGSVLAWTFIPVGTFLGGIAVERTGNVTLIYAIIGLIVLLLPIGFSFTALGRADAYIAANEPPAPQVQEQAS